MSKPSQGDGVVAVAQRYFGRMTFSTNVTDAGVSVTVVGAAVTVNWPWPESPTEPATRSLTVALPFASVDCVSVVAPPVKLPLEIARSAAGPAVLLNAKVAGVAAPEVVAVTL